MNTNVSQPKVPPAENGLPPARLMIKMPVSAAIMAVPLSEPPLLITLMASDMLMGNGLKKGGSGVSLNDMILALDAVMPD